MNTPLVDSPEVRLRCQGELQLAARVWRLTHPLLAVTSAPLGGGLGLRHWVCNAQVAHDYDGDDPERDLTLLAEEAGVSGQGAGMMTAVDVRTASVVRQDGIYVDATVGVAGPQWAAADDAWPDAPDASGGAGRPKVGTINVVVLVPERLSDGALVNAVGTATEAKTQALWEAGIKGTGTATDALCILCPTQGSPHSYGGPRSDWGSRLARAVHLAVLSGCTRTRPT